MGIQTILDRTENNTLKWEIDVLSDYLTVRGRKKKRKTRNELGKASEKSDEAEESNT
jgi:hypothetical protein